MPLQLDADPPEGYMWPWGRDLGPQRGSRANVSFGGGVCPLSRKRGVTGGPFGSAPETPDSGQIPEGKCELVCAARPFNPTLRPAPQAPVKTAPGPQETPS